MPAPLVTIIVPVFNGERYLRESLDSILAQTYAPTEVLVMDDASTDGTAAIIASYGDRVRGIRAEKNRGIYDNANVGIAQARGEFIAIYHADDIYEREIVAREVAWLEAHPDAGAVFTMDTFVDEAGREYGRLTLPPELRGSRPLDYATIFNALLTYKNRLLRCPSAMVRASTHKTVGVYRQDVYRNSSDLDMWLRIARAQPIGIIEEHLFRYRHTAGQSSTRYHHLRTDPERFFRIMDDYLAEDGRLATPGALAAYEGWRAQDRLMIAGSHYIQGDRAKALSVLRTVHARTILGGHAMQRGRMFALWAAMHVLCRMPRIAPVANAFYQRWHVKTARAA